MDRTRILIVDDDENIAELISLYLHFLLKASLWQAPSF